MFIMVENGIAIFRAEREATYEQLLDLYAIDWYDRFLLGKDGMLSDEKCQMISYMLSSACYDGTGDEFWKLVNDEKINACVYQIDIRHGINGLLIRLEGRFGTYKEGYPPAKTIEEVIERPQQQQLVWRALDYPAIEPHPNVLWIISQCLDSEEGGR